MSHLDSTNINTTTGPYLLQLCWTAIRPFSFPASVFPVLIGTASAVVATGTNLKVGYAVTALLGLLMLQAGVNILNDAEDYLRGFDQEIQPASGAVVRGWLHPTTARWAAAILLTGGALLGLLLTAQVGLPLLPVGIVGISLGVGYSIAPLNLKYRAAGDAAVLISFGLLATLGAWLVQTSTMSWIPVLWSLPIGLLTTAILHANNWRDQTGDKLQGGLTIAQIWGNLGSLRYYQSLIMLPFVLVAALALLGLTSTNSFGLPITSLVVILAAPLAQRLLTTAKQAVIFQRPQLLLDLDRRTAQLNLLFGLLYFSSFIIETLLQ